MCHLAVWYRLPLTVANTNSDYLDYFDRDNKHDYARAVQKMLENYYLPLKSALNNAVPKDQLTNTPTKQ